MERWSFHYLVSLALAISNTIFLTVIFKFQDQRSKHPSFYQTQVGGTDVLRAACLIEGGEPVDEPIEEDKNKGQFKQIMTNKTVNALALFVLVYVGVEVTIGGTWASFSDVSGPL